MKDEEVAAAGDWVDQEGRVVVENEQEVTL
jgi:hypothetical protein